MTYMYRLARKIHLWLGLIFTILLLSEAITGLILAEPWLVGQKTAVPPPVADAQRPATLADSEHGPKTLAEQKHGSSAGTASNAVKIAKQLHQGRIGSFNLKWLIDLTAIALVIITITGVYIAIPLLRPRQKR